MLPVNQQPGRAPDRPRRRTVRIVKPRWSRTTTISLGIAVAAAVLLTVGWRFWHGEEVAPPRQTTWDEWQMRWRCDAGHYFPAAAQVGARMCIHIDCDKPAYPVTKYSCPRHGAIEVNVLFGPDDEGRPHTVQLRQIGGQWVSVREGLRCPRCGHPLEYTGDPLAGVGRSRSPDGN